MTGAGEMEVFFSATGTRWEKEEEEEKEANMHIWRQKEMISLVNFASHSPSSWHFIPRWREMVCPNDPCLESCTCKATGWGNMRVCESSRH